VNSVKDSGTSTAFDGEHPAGKDESGRVLYAFIDTNGNVQLTYKPISKMTLEEQEFINSRIQADKVRQEAIEAKEVQNQATIMKILALIATVLNLLVLFK
jgi:hypothetical protein